MPEQVIVTLQPGTLQRLERVGFPASWQEMLQFLIEQGLNVIEKHRLPKVTN
jgi:hypothetical protein